MSRVERVDRLIEATKRTIERAGIKGATFRAIVKEADESLGTATYYFTSLEHLVESAMRDTMATQLARSRSWFAARQDVDRVELLMEWFLSRIQQTEDVEHGYVMYLAAISQPGYQHVAKEWVAGYVGVLEEVTGDHASAVLVDALLDGCFVRVMLGGPEAIGDAADLRAALRAIVGEPMLASATTQRETSTT